MSSASLLSSGALESLAAIDTVSFRGLVEQIWESIDHFGVELRVVAAAILVLLLDVMVPLKFSKYLAWVSVGLCLWIAGSLMGHHLEPEHSRLFLGMISYDSFSSFYKLLFIVGIVPVILMGYVSNSLQGRRMGEFYALLFISVFGAMLMASSTHFIMLFMSLEILSISSYVLVGYLRRDRGGVEASLKYIIYGSIASAIMAFGMSLYYGLTGSADLADLAHVVRADGPLGDKDSSRIAIMTLVSLLMIFAGIAYKIASVPMHFWAPDAYEGAPTAVTAFLAVIS
ncbi:MAG: proton-conducting transporter membrane subunit, partial [Planctomycetota bacterium]